MKFTKVLSASAAAATAVAAFPMIVMTSCVVVTSAYTFDPLNNMWKPSGGKNAAAAAAARRSSSFASSYAPQPSDVEAPPVFEEEVIRAQYSTWAGHYHNGVNKEHGESFEQKSLVQIEYNKRTGEVALVDTDGVISRDDYQNLMRAISTGNAKDAHELTNVVEGTTAGLGVVDQDVTLGTTHFVDGEDIDQSGVIDTSCQEVHAVAVEDVSATSARPEQQQATHATEYHQTQPHHQNLQQQEVAATESFQTYEIPLPPVEIQTQLQEQQYQQLQHIQQHQQHQLQYQHQGHAMMTFQPAQMQAQQHVPSSQATAVSDLSSSETAAQSAGWGFNDRRSTFIK